MVEYLVVGLGAGILFYLIKVFLFHIGTQGKYTNWIRRTLYSSPLGLFVFDLIAGTVLTSTLHTVGAQGLTALFIFIGFSLCSAIYIACNMMAKWTRRTLCNHGF